MKSALLVDDMALQTLLVEDPGGPLLLLAQVQLQLRVRHQRQLQICIHPAVIFNI